MSMGLLAAAAAPQSALPAGPAATFIVRRRAFLAAAGVWLVAVVAAIAVFA
jgi:hypothetical protein